MQLGVLSKNISHQYVLRTAMYVFPLITLPYLTRVLGPATFAVRAYVLSIMSLLAAFLDYGFNTFGTRAVSISRNDRAELNILMSGITILRLSFCLIGIVPLFALSAFIPIISENLLYTLIAYLGICFRALLPDFVFQGLEDMGIITRRYLVSQGIAVLMILAFVHGSSDIIAVPIIEGAAALIALVWSWGDVLIRRELRFCLPTLTSIRNILRESSMLFLSSIATTAFTALTTVLIGIYFEETVQISYWSLAMTAMGVAQGLFTPINNSLYPHLSANQNYSIVKRFLIAGIPLTALASVLFAILSKPIMLILGGGEYVAGSYVLVYISPMILFSYIAVLLGFPVLGALGETRLLTASSVFAAVFHILGLVVLLCVSHFDITSVALLRTSTECVFCLIRAIFVLRCFRKSNDLETLD